MRHTRRVKAELPKHFRPSLIRLLVVVLKVTRGAYRLEVLLLAALFLGAAIIRWYSLISSGVMFPSCAWRFF